MKKRVFTLITFVMICTLCTCFVACSREVHVGGLCGFAVNNEFTFGRIKVETENFVLGDHPSTRSAYPDIYDIVFENDTAFQPTIDKIQQVYTLCRQRVRDINEYTNIEVLSDCLAGNQSVLSDGYENESIYVDIEAITSMERGYVFEAHKVWSVCVVHETYNIGGYNVVYFSKPVGGGVGKNTTSTGAEFIFTTFIYKEGMTRAITFSTTVFFKTDFMMQIIFAEATIEERHEIAQYYQPIHKEIITKFINSEEGQKYLEKWIK